MNPSPFNTSSAGGGSLTLSEHQEKSRDAQRQADRWLITGAMLLGTMILGFIGIFVFLRGLSLQVKAQQEGLTMRPTMVTLIGYLVAIDAAINSFGWALDLFAHHTLLTRVVMTAWGNFFDGGYFWHYNEWFVGGNAAPGEKSWEFALVTVVFTMRIAAAIGFLQMKRWGHQWLIVTCWFGVVIWVGYIANMTLYADVRFANIVMPVVGWWLFDIFYISPFLAIPYLHSVNREIFVD